MRSDDQISRLSSLAIGHSTGSIYPSVSPSTAYFGTLDIKNNSLFISYGSNPGDGQAAYNAIEDMVRSGYHGGDWLGKGITSTKAATIDPFLYGVNVYDNAIAGLNYGTASLPTNTIVVKFGYNGDTNGDGRVDGDDYVAIDMAMVGSPLYYTSLLAGDTNHDGFINTDDYSYIDMNILDPLANPALSGRASSVPLPEPSSFALGLLGLIGLLIARRRVTLRTEV